MYDNDPTMMGGENRPPANLVVRQGTQAGMSFPITGNQVVVGREEGLDIILQDAEASRRHTRVSWQGGQYVIEDLGSTNGTFINGVQITAPRVLNPGDSIGIGQTVLVFQMAGGQYGGSPYQAPAQPANVGGAGGYAPVPGGEAGADNNNLLQYSLYGCGCLLLLCICSLAGVVIFALIDPTSFEAIFRALGFELSLTSVPLSLPPLLL